MCSDTNGSLQPQTCTKLSWPPCAGSDAGWEPRPGGQASGAGMRAPPSPEHVAFPHRPRKPPAGGQFGNVHLATVAFFVQLVCFILSMDGSQGLGTEVALGMKEENFTPSGCDSPWTKINEETVNIYPRLQGDLGEVSGR